MRFEANKTDGTQQLTKQERDARNKRQSRLVAKIKYYTELLAEGFRTANLTVVIESGLSNHFPFVTARHGANDASWNAALTAAIQQAMLAKSVYPKSVFAGLIAPSPLDRASLEETLSAAQSRGILAPNQVHEILDIANTLKKAGGKFCLLHVPPLFDQTDIHNPFPFSRQRG